ncbi:MAG TPA: DUF1638 domain-containing protein [Desulfobacterales bacterium]|jgi:Protein of unknown function (DUF1638)|nr:DUF1638 domain-containing protein [Desulfobacterales bacterium]
MRNRKSLIACKIFEHELNKVLSPDTDVTIHWIDAALHANPIRMKKEFTDAITAAENDRVDDICFLFGNGCHPDIWEITESCGAQLPSVKNCIQAIIGPEKTKQLEANRTMVITPGWITAWPGIMAEFGWDEVDVRINLGRYDRILLLDPGIVPINDEEILAFYDLVQVPVEIEQVDLTYFRHLIEQILPKTVENNLCKTTEGNS